MSDINTELLKDDLFLNNKTKPVDIILQNGVFTINSHVEMQSSVTTERKMRKINQHRKKMTSLITRYTDLI
jgi:hypothetical protein